MYVYPQEVKCPRCEFTCTYGPSDPFHAPILSEGPICPKCYADFLRQHLPVMEHTDTRAPRVADREKRPGAGIRNFYS
jgi:hypothetical protein